MRRDDVELWLIGLVLLLASIRAVVWIVGLLAKFLLLVLGE